ESFATMSWRPSVDGGREGRAAGFVVALEPAWGGAGRTRCRASIGAGRTTASPSAAAPAGARTGGIRPAGTAPLSTGTSTSESSPTRTRIRPFDGPIRRRPTYRREYQNAP